MKYVKMLGLLAVTAAALMAFAGTASATLTNENGTLATSLHSKSSGATSLTGSITITCQKSTVGGGITTNDATEASGPVETLEFSECGNHTVTVTAKGTLRIVTSDGTTGTVYSTGARVTVLLHSFLLGTVHCIYETNNTHIGTFTESTHTPTGGTKHKTATMHIEETPIPRAPTDGACGETSIWEGTYEVISPDELFLD